MRQQIAVLVYSAVLGFMTLSSHAIAQQKTAKACQEEWRANKATNQANGVTERLTWLNAAAARLQPRQRQRRLLHQLRLPQQHPQRDKRLPGLAATSGGPTRPLTRPTASRKRPMSLNAAAARPPSRPRRPLQPNRHLLRR